jgi:hypothetical protein
MALAPIQLTTHHQANILTRLLSAEVTRLTDELNRPEIPAFAREHLKNERDAVEGLYILVYNASTTPSNRI